MNKFLTSALLPSLMLTMFLQACGDSSGKAEGPVEPVDYTFTLTANLANECGVKSAFTDFELLIQDDTWQTLSSHKPDESGVVSLITQSEFINYTIVAKNQEDNYPEGINVESYYQASSETPAFYNAQFDELQDNLSCECVTHDLELTHRAFATQASVTSSLEFSTWQAIDESTTLFEGVNVCRAIGDPWPLHSFSVTGGDVNDVDIAAAVFTSDFDSNKLSKWQRFALDVADIVELETPHQQFITNQLLGNTQHFTELVTEDVDNLLVFKSHNYTADGFYQTKASVSFLDRDNGSLGSSVLKTSHQVISTQLDESLLAKASEKEPSVDYDFFSEIKSDGTYDYSKISGYSMVVIAEFYTIYEPESRLLIPAKWTYYGAMSGTRASNTPLVGFENYFDSSDFYTQRKVRDVRLINSASAGSYSDYIKYYQAGNTVDTALDASSEFIKNIKTLEISLLIN